MDDHNELMIRRDDFDPGVPAESWSAAKSEARKAMTEVARQRRTMSYTELVRQIDSLHIVPHDHRLAHMLGEISTEEDNAGRGLLTVVVVHQGGDMRPGLGFFELAKARGRDISDRDRCWVAELERVYLAWSGARDE